MKRCPQCHSTYTDDALKYCLQDGAQLVAFDLSQAETLITPGQEAAKSIPAPPGEQVLISISEMLQLLLELNSATSMLEAQSDQIKWIRTKDETEIDDIDRNTVSALLRLDLLRFIIRLEANGRQRQIYILTEKAERIIKARESRSPAHVTPYLGEKFWLVVHTHSKGMEIYPYLGTAPPDLAMLINPDWRAKEYKDFFTISCYPLDGRIALEELLPTK